MRAFGGPRSNGHAVAANITGDRAKSSQKVTKAKKEFPSISMLNLPKISSQLHIAQYFCMPPVDAADKAQRPMRSFHFGMPAAKDAEHPFHIEHPAHRSTRIVTFPFGKPARIGLLSKSSGGD